MVGTTADSVANVVEVGLSVLVGVATDGVAVPEYPLPSLDRNPDPMPQTNPAPIARTVRIPKINRERFMAGLAVVADNGFLTMDFVMVRSRAPRARINPTSCMD